MAAVLTLVQTKQMRINIHQRNSEKNTIQNTQIQVHILPKQPHNCQNTTPPPHPAHTRPHITKQVKTITVQDTQQIK